MGGYGSGTRTGEAQRPEKEECMTLSSTYLYREGFLEHDQSWERPVTMTYSRRRSQKEHTIGVYTQSDQIRLEYTIKKSGGEKEKHSYTASVEWTPCNFGGHRPWFRCPAQGCYKRVEKLYKPFSADIFACRHCYDITYRRCNISGKPTMIAMHKKRKIAEKLGDDNPTGKLGATPPPKPKHMHWSTYENLLDEWKYWSNEHHRRFVKGARELMGRLR